MDYRACILIFKKMKNRLIFYLLFAIPIIGFSQSKQITEIVILHVNDMHGRIDQFPVLSSMIQDIKAKHKNVILVSAGDMFSGNPIVDKYSEKGYPMIDFMNDLKFDISTLGNHEFDFGTLVLAKRISEAKFPFIAANISSKTNTFPKLAPFKNYKFGKIKMSILGITQVEPSGHPDTRPENCKDVEFTQGITKAKEFSALSKKANVFIVLSHMGVIEDSVLATKMPEINTIIGGHSHKALQPQMKVNGVTIVQAGYYLKYLGMLTIKLDGKKIISINDTLLPLKGYPHSDTLIARKVKNYNNNEEFKKIAGYFGNDLKGDNELGGFMSDAALKAVKADFSFQNSGGIRVSEIPAGPITIKQVYELDPFANEIMICKMTAAQIRELIEYGYKKEKKADIISAGINSVIYLKADKTIEKIDLSFPDGSLVDEKKVYQIAINSYVASSYKFSKTGEAFGTGITTTDAIIRLLSLIKSANYSGIESTKIITK